MNKRQHLDNTPPPLNGNAPLFYPSFPYLLTEPTNKGGAPTWDAFHPQLPPADLPMPFFSSALCEPDGTHGALPHLSFSGNFKFSSPQAACSLQGNTADLQAPPSLQGLQELWELSNKESPPSWGAWSAMASEEDPPMNAWPCFLNAGMAPPNSILNGCSQTSSVFASTACKLGGGGMTQINKQRLRWTPELHKQFVEAVSQLGGPETRAEKKRSTSSLEHSGALDTTIALQMTQSLRLQMEMQKQLHDQLEVQRKLQLRIEEQGKHLQRMFEKQQKGRPPTSPHLIQLGVDSHIPSTKENHP